MPTNYQLQREATARRREADAAFDALADQIRRSRVERIQLEVAYKAAVHAAEEAERKVRDVDLVTGE